MKVKKCPFCGEEQDIHMRANYSPKMRVWLVFIKCEVFGGQTKVFPCEEDPESEEWENDACVKALRAWNKRNGRN